jgi:hypothetical protein
MTDTGILTCMRIFAVVLIIAGIWGIVKKNASTVFSINHETVKGSKAVEQGVITVNV